MVVPDSVSFTPSTRSLIVLLDRSTAVPLSESLALPADPVIVLAGALPPTLSCCSAVESPLRVNALSVPVGPLSVSRALPSLSVTIVAATPLFCALIALAMPSSVLLVESIVIEKALVSPVRLETAESLAVPSVSVSVPVPTSAVRLANLVVLVVVCAVASWVTSTNADKPDSFAPESALALSTLVSLLVGCVWRLPPLTSVVSPDAKLVIALWTLATDEICRGERRILLGQLRILRCELRLDERRDEARGIDPRPRIERVEQRLADRGRPRRGCRRGHAVGPIALLSR